MVIFYSLPPGHYSNKKEGRQLDFASCPSAATIFNKVAKII
tara:strand:+ start:898 stop:1020 length:123 start_codon:yes stop_codon:yes gene_type:complete